MWRIIPYYPILSRRNLGSTVCGGFGDALLCGLPLHHPAQQRAHAAPSPAVGLSVATTYEDPQDHSRRAQLLTVLNHQFLWPLERKPHFDMVSMFLKYIWHHISCLYSPCIISNNIKYIFANILCRFVVELHACARITEVFKSWMGHASHNHPHHSMIHCLNPYVLAGEIHPIAIHGRWHFGHGRHQAMHHCVDPGGGGVLCGRGLWGGRSDGLRWFGMAIIRSIWGS